MLVRLVQLLYLQTKLNASKGDKNISKGKEEARFVVNQVPVPATPTQSTLMDQLLQHRQRYTQQQRYMIPPRTAQTNIRPYSSNPGPRVYRMGSSVTQVYSKNYPVGHANVQSANSWANDISSRTLYFNNVQSDMRPWFSNRSQATASFKPNYSQQHHYDNRYARVASYAAAPRYGYSYRPTTDY